MDGGSLKEKELAALFSRLFSPRPNICSPSAKSMSFSEAGSSVAWSTESGKPNWGVLLSGSVILNSIAEDFPANSITSQN